MKSGKYGGRNMRSAPVALLHQQLLEYDGLLHYLKESQNKIIDRTDCNIHR